MAKWIKSGWLIPLLLLMLIISACSSKDTGKTDPTKGIDDEINTENPSGDLSPLKEKTKVIIAEDGAASGAGFYIAKEKGYFEDYNIEVEFAQFANSDDMLPALSSR